MAQCDNWVTHLLVCLFGIGSWIAINGLWVELPILVQHLPEAWDLGSYLVIIIQVANIGPLLYTAATTLAPGKVNERPVVYGLVFIGTVSCLLLAFLWDKTSIIAGREHSTALLTLQFFLALVDCTSSVVFLPFMATFKTQYMTTYFIGEGFSGLLPSAVSLIQGAGQVRCVNSTNTTLVNQTTQLNETQGLRPEYLNPNFPVEAFFLFLFAMMAVCGIAFTLLNFHPVCKREHVEKTKTLIEDNSNSSSTSGVKQNEEQFSTTESGNSSEQLLPENDPNHPQAGNYGTSDTAPKIKLSIKTTEISSSSFLYLLVLTAWINALTNGVLPSIQSYSCLPYGMDAYHLAVTLASIANPLACFIAYFLSTVSKTIISILTVLGSGIAAYIILLASLSPTPYFAGQATGQALVICSWVMTTLFLTYAKISIATILRSKGRRGLLGCGALTQVGSAAGAIVMFVLVSVVHLFTTAPTCPT